MANLMKMSKIEFKEPGKGRVFLAHDHVPKSFKVRMNFRQKLKV